MKDFLHDLIDSLREELKEYGEMLALLEQQQALVMRRQTQDLLVCTQDIAVQVDNITAARREREQRRRNVARLFGLAEDTPFGQIVAHLPGEYRPLVQALVQENNELLLRIRRRARQNHLLLSRVVELMQRLFYPFFPDRPPATYNDSGALTSGAAPNHSFYEAIG